MTRGGRRKERSMCGSCVHPVAPRGAAGVEVAPGFGLTGLEGWSTRQLPLNRVAPPGCVRPCHGGGPGPSPAAPVRASVVFRALSGVRRLGRLVVAPGLAIGCIGHGDGKRPPGHHLVAGDEHVRPAVDFGMGRRRTGDEKTGDGETGETFRDLHDMHSFVQGFRKGRTECPGSFELRRAKSADAALMPIPVVAFSSVH